MIGFKGFYRYKNFLRCRAFALGNETKLDFSEGEKLSIIDVNNLARDGFYFCRSIRDVFKYQPLRENSVYYKVKSGENIIRHVHYCVSDEIILLEEVKKDEKFNITAVEWDGTCIQYIPKEDRTERVKISAMGQNGHAIHLLDKDERTRPVVATSNFSIRRQKGFT